MLSLLCRTSRRINYAMNYPSNGEIPTRKTLPAPLSKTLGTGKQRQDDERTELASVDTLRTKA